jgi:hypothetical protein
MGSKPLFTMIHEPVQSDIAVAGRLLCAGCAGESTVERLLK